MAQVFDTDTGKSLGTITEDQLQFLIDQMEEESDTDQDYYINRDLLNRFKENGIDADLLAMLENAMGEREGMEIEWK
jgi:hypothetical protein